MVQPRTTRALVSTQRSELKVTRASSVVGQVSELFPLWRASCEEAKVYERWYRNNLTPRDLPKLPNKAGKDIKDLRDESPTSWAKMIADSLSQDFIADGIRMTASGDMSPAYQLWQRNGLDSRQKPVHDGVIRHGKAFNLIGSAVGRLDGKRTAFIRGKSALNCDAFFRDDFDEYPDVFIEGQLQTNVDGSKQWRIDFWDDVAHHWLSCEQDGSKMEYITYEPHGMGLCPVVRAAGNIDLTGRTIGEIEPYITLFRRINQSTMDRLVVQRFGAFVVRWIAGIEEPETDELKRAAAIALSMTDLLVSGSGDTKFGSLPATPLDGYIKSREADIRDLSAVSQTASFHMLGLSDNVGAEGLAAAEASHARKGELWKISLGEFWETSLRLAGFAAGLPEVASDFESRMHWKDTRTQSFQSLAQGLGTLATQLGIPGEALWSRIPDWEAPDTVNAKRIATEMAAQAAVEAALAAAAAPKGAPGASNAPAAQ